MATVTPSEPRTAYVFLSYASADRERALRIADGLEARGISVWIDRKSIAGGTSWSGEIVEGIKGGTAILALISPSAVASPNVQQELQLAWEHRRPILPLLLTSTTLPSSVEYVLAGRQWIEVLDEADDVWLPRVLRALAAWSIGRPPAVSPLAPVSTDPPNADPKPPIHRPSSNLPTEITSFVGRERELREIREQLKATRLLTLTGIGGCGKTRLALKVAEAALGDFPDGVWLVELAPLVDPALVLPAVATAVGVREEPGQPLQATLLAALRDRRLLLVLDNCEHLLDACARLVDVLLRGCSQLQILATSREALGIGGEVARRVPSLTTPPTDQPTPIERLAEYEAVQLFVARALTVQPGFVMTNQNASAVAQLCWRLDGIPLAIELAAARVRVLTVEQISSRLSDRFRLLTGGSRTALRRQQTLSAAIDWSHDLLTPSERVLFRRLAVFAGGWTLEAAEGVCGDGESGGLGVGEDLSPPPSVASLPAIDVLDLLTGLVDKSLVLADGQSGDTRYRFLETIRQYAGEKLLAAGEAEAMRDRQRDWYLRLAEQAKPKLIGPEQVHWLDQLEGERDNLRAALEWSLDRGTAELALRLAAAVWRLWFVRDNLGDALELLLRVLAAPGAAGPTRARAEVLDGACELAINREMGEPALRLGEACLAMYRALGDRPGIAWALCHLANLASNNGNVERAEELAAEALAQARGADAPWVVAQALGALGQAAQFRGDFSLTRRYYAESLATFRALGDLRAIFAALIWLTISTYEQGDYGLARAYARQALVSARELRSKDRMSSALVGLGMIARQEGDAAESWALLEEGLALARDTGSRTETAGALLNLGWLAWADGNVGRAEGLAKESLAVSRDMGMSAQSPAGLAAAIGFLGVLAVSRGAYLRAARLLGAVATRPVPPLWLPREDRRVHEESAAAARVALGEAGYAAAWATGEAMTLEQAVDYAFSDDQSEK